MHTYICMYTRPHTINKFTDLTAMPTTIWRSTVRGATVPLSASWGTDWVSPWNPPRTSRGGFVMFVLTRGSRWGGRGWGLGRRDPLVQPL